MPQMHRDEWMLFPRFGPPFRVVRWTDLMGGEAFQESLSELSIGEILDELERNDALAASILADIQRHGWYGSRATSEHDEEAREFLRSAFRDGHYVIVAAHPPGEIAYEQLHAIMPTLPQSTAEGYLPLLITAMTEAHITTPLRQAAFLAQLAVESGELRSFEENTRGVRSGEQYEGRRDLGNTQPGDGKLFKGRGPIQLTGRGAYRECGRALGLDLENNPQLVATPNVGFRAAGWFWTWKGLNSLADVGNFDEITYRVNGGYTDRPQRDAYYHRARRILDVASP